MKRARITGMGHYVPERVVTNKELEQHMDTSHEWIVERTGIEERRWITEGETVHGMGIKAAEMAIERAGIDPETIDLVICASVISDYLLPGSASQIQQHFCTPGTPAMDIRNACSGFIYALSVADQFIKTGMYETILVVGSEIQSTSLDLSTRGRDTAVIFADGAGAVVVQAGDGDGPGILTTKLHADGTFADKLVVKKPSPGHRPRIYPELLDDPDIFPHMEGRYVFKHAVTRFPEVIQEALEETGYSVADLDLFIPHQANLRISEAVGQRLGMAPEKVFSNIQRYGNTTAATIPICLSEAFEQGMLGDDKLVVLAAFGAGFTWASALIRF